MHGGQAHTDRGSASAQARRIRLGTAEASAAPRSACTQPPTTGACEAAPDLGRRTPGADHGDAGGSRASMSANPAWRHGTRPLSGRATVVTEGRRIGCAPSRTRQRGRRCQGPAVHAGSAKPAKHCLSRDHGWGFICQGESGSHRRAPFESAFLLFIMLTTWDRGNEHHTAFGVQLGSWRTKSLVTRAYSVSRRYGSGISNYARAHAECWCIFIWAWPYHSESGSAGLSNTRQVLVPDIDGAMHSLRPAFHAW